MISDVILDSDKLKRFLAKLGYQRSTINTLSEHCLKMSRNDSIQKTIEPGK